MPPTPGASVDAGSLAALDLLSARLTQVQGVLQALTADPDEHLIPHSAMMASLWAARTLLDQAQEAARAIGAARA